jgi:hypothetical protein
MTNLTVTHKALGKADGERRSIKLRVSLGSLGVSFGETGHVWGLGSSDGIALGRRLGSSNAPAIDNNYKVALARGESEDLGDEPILLKATLWSTAAIVGVYVSYLHLERESMAELKQRNN